MVYTITLLDRIDRKFTRQEDRHVNVEQITSDRRAGELASGYPASPPGPFSNQDSGSAAAGGSRSSMPRKPGYTSYSPAVDGSEMHPNELEFLLAIEAFQRRTGRRYPTWREVLHVAHCLGYRKIAERAVGLPWRCPCLCSPES
jgi:hypothetical protein